MKRIALSLMAFALTGAMAFAQDAPAVKFAGYVNAGVKVVNNSSGTTYAERANDYGNDGTIARLTATLAGSNYGYVLAPIVKGGTTVAFDTAYAWFSPLEGLRFVAGNGNDNPLGELDDAGKGYFSQGGVTAEYSMSGFTLGGVVTPNAPGAAAGTWAAPVVFGARYALPNAITVNATAGTNGTSQLDAVYVTASVTALRALTLTGGYNSTAMATTALSFIDATGLYKITDALTAGAVVYYYSTDKAYYTTGAGSKAGVVKYVPKFSYALGSGLTFSAYLQGDTDSNANYEPQAELDWSPLAGSTIKTQVLYDTNPTHAGSAVAATTVESDFILSY